MTLKQRTPEIGGPEGLTLGRWRGQIVLTLYTRCICVPNTPVYVVHAEHEAYKLHIQYQRVLQSGPDFS